MGGILSFLLSFLASFLLSFAPAKASLPALELALGVEVRLMESPPWPAFLTGSGGERVGIRGDKQRLIWAYKLLFLDALFLGKADRVVFVDADQVRLETPHHKIKKKKPK